MKWAQFALRPCLHLVQKGSTERRHFLYTQRNYTSISTSRIDCLYRCGVEKPVRGPLVRGRHSHREEASWMFFRSDEQISMQA
ncbi:hypothetical protein PVBG_01362 [Plasmodium vivax Brazil I]|uniref:Uncharacterized protein n=1 Tax=Plasmodium vivax (strain Brazil I) TaxID=1033975 RepID=A0A0J9VEM6_PLAV1|nr:hypothetical protein PVBG_01362 [Plasmodium vivax Brazil I]